MLTTQSDAVLSSKEKKVGYSIAGSLSLFIHLGLFFLVGTVVIVDGYRKPALPPTTEIIDEIFPPEPPLPPVKDEPQEPEDPGFAPSALPQAPAQVISISAPSSIPAPVFTQNPNLPPGLDKLPKTSGDPARSPTKPVAMIFDAPVSEGKFGVILDCSGSAHPYLMAAFREIDKNFQNVPTVLTVGCGIGSPKDVEVGLYGRLRRDKEKDKTGSRSIQGQLALAEEKNKDLERYLDRMKKRDNVWAINGGDIYGTTYGFEELIKQGVTTIYWFSDLQDSIDPKVFEKLISDLKRRDVKVIVHNFSGRAVTALPAKMAEETGGTTIAKVPK